MSKGTPMDIETFRASIARATPPDDLPLALQAMWWDAKGNWDKAHDCAQEQKDKLGDWVHAYLHRKEGDLDNAGYWYRRLGLPLPQVTFDREWTDIVGALFD